MKIMGETPKSGKPLCITCKHARTVKGQNGQEQTRCVSGLFGESGLVTFPVYSCSAFHPSNMPWLHEMEQMAWMIEARKRGPRGFADGVPIKDTGEMEVIITKPRRNGTPAEPQV